MAPECLLECSEQFTTGPYPEQQESIAHPGSGYLPAFSIA